MIDGRPVDGEAPTPHDLARIDALVEQLDAAHDLETFGRTVAAGLAALFPCISTSYNELNPEAGRAFAVIVPEPDEGWWAQHTPVFEALVHQHPFVHHLRDGGPGTAHTWDDFPGGARAFRTTELYRRFYAPLGIESQLLAQLPAPGDIVVGVAVNRGPEGFSERDRAVLDTFRSHAVRAYRLVQRTVERDVLGRMLSDHGWQVVLVDDDGTIVSTTSADPSWAAGAPLPAPVLDRFRDTSGAPFWASPAVEVPVHIAGVSPGTEVLVNASIVRNRVPPHVVHIRSGAPVSRRRLRDLGLTERQATVAALMAGGANDAAIATELGISRATVKKHLEHIYRALDVSSRAAAVAVIATGP